jgi:hypothetical protein
LLGDIRWQFVARHNPVTMARIAKTVRAASVMPFPTAVRMYRGTDKGEHGYAEPYQRHLGHLRYRQMGVIEIGVGGYSGARPSGSLRLWRDWFPRATVVGIDLHHKRVRLGRRVRFVQGDQSDADVLARAVQAAGGPPTVVVDDGSHVGEHILASFRYLFPRMAPGSVYVIEDLHTSYWTAFGGDGVAPASSGVGVVKRLVDSVQDADLTFDRRPELGGRPTVTLPGAADALHVYPGIAFAVRG